MRLRSTAFLKWRLPAANPGGAGGFGGGDAGGGSVAGGGDSGGGCPGGSDILGFGGGSGLAGGRDEIKHFEREYGEILPLFKYLVDPFPALEFFGLVPGKTLRHSLTKIAPGKPRSYRNYMSIGVYFSLDSSETVS